MTEDHRDRELLVQARERQTDLEARHLLARVRHRIAGVSEPAKVGRYTINRRIGAGAMGRVFAAYDRDLDREVAIKVIEVSDSQSHVRMLEEARALARLSHPNIVEVYDVVVDRQQLGIVMQLLKGLSLSRWGEGRPQREVIRAFAAAARGLAAAHAQDICHRDFKPANVIVDAVGHVRLVDFGLSLAPGVHRAAGTPAYVAPEQARGDQSDARSDQYSFCVALYEALVGTLPDRFELQIPGTLGRRLRRVLWRGLSRSPSDRYSDMGALLNDLQARARWRVVVVGAAAMLGAAVLGTQPSAPDPCAEQSEGLAAVWSDPRRQRIAAAFERSGAPPEMASDVQHRILPRLDEFAERWRGVAASTCDDTSPASPGRACLQRSLSRFNGLLDVLETADASTLARSARAISALDPPSRCETADPTAEDQALREELDRARMLYDLGEFEPSRRAAHAIAAETTTVGRGDALAEARWLEGIALGELGEQDRAQRALQTAFRAADRLDLDELAALCASALMASTGIDQGDAAEAERWYRHAQARLDRGAVGDVVRGQVLVNWGTVLAAHGRFADALDPHQKALVAFTAGLEDGDARLAASRSALVTTLLGLGRYSEAAEHQTAALAIQRRTLGSHHPALAASHQNLGTAMLGLGRMAEAREHLSAAVASQTTHFGADHLTVGTTLLSVGYLHTELAEYDQAQMVYRRAIEILQDKSPPMLQRAREGLATALVRAGRTADAVAMQRRVVDGNIQTLGPDNPRTLATQINLAEYLLEAGDRVAADRLATEATAQLRGHEASPTARANAERVTGRIALAAGKYQDAEVALVHALAHDAFPEFARAMTTFQLALAVAPVDLRRARKLAEQACAGLADHPRHRGTVEAWLVDHPAQ